MSGDFYSYIGGLIFLVLLINILMILKLRRLSFLPIKYIQIMMIFLLSKADCGQEVINLISPLSVFKLSFEFLGMDSLNKMIAWYNHDTKMQNLHFYWTSTLANYKWAIALFLFWILIYFAFKFTLKRMKWFEDLANWISKTCCLRYVYML